MMYSNLCLTCRETLPLMLSICNLQIVGLLIVYYLYKFQNNTSKIKVSRISFIMQKFFCILDWLGPNFTAINLKLFQIIDNYVTYKLRYNSIKNEAYLIQNAWEFSRNKICGFTIRWFPKYRKSFTNAQLHGTLETVESHTTLQYLGNHGVENNLWKANVSAVSKVPRSCNTPVSKEPGSQFSVNMCVNLQAHVIAFKAILNQKTVL